MSMQDPCFHTYVCHSTCPSNLPGSRSLRTAESRRCRRTCCTPGFGWSRRYIPDQRKTQTFLHFESDYACPRCHTGHCKRSMTTTAATNSRLACMLDDFYSTTRLTLDRPETDIEQAATNAAPSFWRDDSYSTTRLTLDRPETDIEQAATNAAPSFWRDDSYPTTRLTLDRPETDIEQAATNAAPSFWCAIVTLNVPRRVFATLSKQQVSNSKYRRTRFIGS